MLNGISLFANIGIAELSLPRNKINISMANEIDPKRVHLYKKLHPKVNVVEGDISKKIIFSELISRKYDFVISTPPCQGMSTAGKMENLDPRNHLIKYSIDLIKKTNPKYIFHENVPGQNNTKIHLKGSTVSIDKFIRQELDENYKIVSQKIDMSKFGIPQSRKRSIYLMTRKDIKKEWVFPNYSKFEKTLFEIIGSLPSLDPEISDKDVNTVDYFPNYFKKVKKALQVSEFHTPSSHPLRQIISMQHTPTGKSAFENIKKFQPKSIDGTDIKGFKNTYKRMEWNKPAPTVTTYNRTISSQQNVHPGREVKINNNIIFSDPRVLTMYEIMKVMTIEKWNLSSNDNSPLLRSLVGEGVPPLFVKKCFNQIS